MPTDRREDVFAEFKIYEKMQDASPIRAQPAAHLYLLRPMPRASGADLQ